jgi:hypothetical protein
MPCSPQAERSPNDLLKHPKLDELEVTLRWRKDWWDGPLNGSVSYRGSRCWFEFYCDDEDGLQYYYLLYPLSDEQADFADTWAEEEAKILDLWRPLANDPAARDSAVLKSLTAQLEAHKPGLPNYCQREPVGWFSSGSNSAFYGVQVHPPTR